MMVRKRKAFLSAIVLLAAVGFTNGCAQQGYSVIAATGTVIGVEISQNPATQAPQAKLGYNRGEFALVPTNRRSPQAAGDTNTGAGARDAANVLMELRYGGIFDPGGKSSIYQRLAVGDIAVSEPGAAALFIKDADGKVDKEALDALKAVKGVAAVEGEVEKEKRRITRKFQEFETATNTQMLRNFDSAAIAAGYPKTSTAYKDYGAFRDFSTYRSSLSEVISIRRALEAQGVKFE